MVRSRRFWLSGSYGHTYCSRALRTRRVTPTGRNRAIDLYRVVAMVFVALGHWLVIAIGTDVDGELFARNALEVMPWACSRRAIGTTAWWIEKIPVVALSLVVLVPLVGIASRVERRALLADRAAWQHGTASALGLAALVSTSIKVLVAGQRRRCDHRVGRRRRGGRHPCARVRAG